MTTNLKECIAPSFYDLHKKLKNDSDIDELWLRGGRASCKSSFVSIEAFLAMIRDPEANGICFRRFENEIRDTVYAQLEWAASKLGIYDLFKWNTSPFKITHRETGQMILFKGADNPKKIKSTKLAHGYLKFAWFEECDQFGGMEEIRNIEQTLFRGTTKNQVAFYTYNPPKSARSWVNEETKIVKPGRVVHSSDYRTVPKEWLGEKFLTNAEHLKEVNEDAYKHEYLGEETGTGLEVFNNVTLRPITDKEISYFDHRSQGLDFGYAADPLCFLEGHFENKKKILYLFHEISGTGIKNSQLAAMLSAEQLAEVTMSDSAEPKSIAELREDYNMNIVPAEKSPGSVDHGIKFLQDLEEIVIDPVRCPLAGREFINYALSVDRYGEVISKYPDKNNHCFVGSTLISTLIGPRRIDEIKVGELVHTRKGLRKVNKVFRNGKKKVITTKLLNGKSLTLTDTHNIVTRDGDVMFKDLTPSDFVYYEVKSCGYIETENRKLQYLKVKNIEDTQKAKDEMTKYISNEQRKKEINIFIRVYMKQKLVRFQKVAIYTIKILTLSTMKYLILFALKVQNILVTMQKSGMKIIKSLLKPILTISDHLQKNGTEAKKVESGIQNMEKKLTRIERLFNLNVSVVEQCTKLRAEAKQGSAQTIVSRSGEENLVLIILKGIVFPVVVLFRLINTIRERNVENVQEVFDLEIDDVHEYFANGLLVHNSIDSSRYLLSLNIKQYKTDKRKNKHKVRAIPVLSRW